MFSRFPSRHCIALASLVAMACPAAHAFEHITLRNGFSVDCVRHEAVGDRTRLYTGDTNYQELASAEIASIETLPDPPKPPPPAPAPAAHADLTATPTLAQLREMLAHAGAEHDIDVDLLASVIKTESNFQVNAVSRAGARGLMQLMPSTAHDLGVQDVTRADQNIAGGTAYLDSLLKLYKDNLALALAAYNAGPAAVAKYHGVPPYRETRAYVSRVIREFNRRKTAQLTTTNVASR
ncbi:lytic transglycosylase domain-containing protein [Granulicella mallensis]|uniref:Soluble lytic murein transglycosylase-like protein n=1 Tax=Granulicella mallensis TaxID=940614 RepID=A0A7W8E959_9BACT|nr:lytic transglycosylase domain-containing protein [Granulicella mallensis]MBB5062015.1 soluble lytic murein transglycosylase-like protein [Granulicella mallensis]